MIRFWSASLQSLMSRSISEKSGIAQQVIKNEIVTEIKNLI